MNDNNFNKSIEVFSSDSNSNSNSNNEIEIIVKQKNKNKTLKEKIIYGKRITKKKPIVFIFEDNNINKNKNQKQSTKKNRLKKPIELVIMEDEKRYNELFIEILEQLYSIMLKQGEIFRAKAYQKAEETIMDYPNNITTVEQLKGLPGIGPTILEKLQEYINTGTLKILEREKTNPVNLITEIYGIGPKKAKELVALGIKNIDDLKKKQNEVLNNVQKIGLQYYLDIQKRIPREEIELYYIVFNKIFDKVKNNNSALEIVGSYRRGALQSGDIDVIITSDSNTIYNNFINDLLKEGIIIEVLSRGDSKCLSITKLNSDAIARRVDFLFTTREEFPFAVLYFTGSKIFNTVMRYNALKKG